MHEQRHRNHDHTDRRRRGVPLSDLDPALTDISRQVIGCAIEVHKALGPGYSDEVYTNALTAALDEQAVEYRRDHEMEVSYLGRRVGRTVADLYVGDRFIVDVMATVGEIGSEERVRLRAQLRAGDLELGLIINFGERRLKDGLVRVLNPDKIEALHRDEHDDEDHDDDED